jgi:ankyrin repeat protein
MVVRAWISAAVLVVASCARPPVAPTVDLAAALVSAVRADSAHAVRELLDRGVSPDTLAPDGTRPLTEAARHGRQAAMQVLLDAGARLDMTDSSGNRALDYAVERAHLPAAAMLTRQAAQDAGASQAVLRWFDGLVEDRPNGTDWRRLLDGELASLGLMAAVLAERPAAVASLRGAAGLTNRTGYGPLHLAARFGDERAVTELLQASASPDLEVAGHLHETPLMEGARDGYVAIGRRLLHAGARVDRVDAAGETALSWAVRAGETDYARMLLDAGANPRLRNREGATALDLARRINHQDLIALLESRHK